MREVGGAVRLVEQRNELVEVGDAAPEDGSAAVVESAPQPALYEAGDGGVQEDQVHAVEVHAAEAVGPERFEGGA
ncbi:hypothetical protein [Streptomyces sp. WAC07149]|uniref:hypothetical protein n=1 Tax=Streptomyces sp. WAC07149 TaxID=2487425 RepID=UPI00163BF9DF|nr:hypothetical protein [Streptomyces sp. WAC07149]